MNINSIQMALVVSQLILHHHHHLLLHLLLPLVPPGFASPVASVGAIDLPDNKTQTRSHPSIDVPFSFPTELGPGLSGMR